MALTWVRSLVWASAALVVFVGCAAEAPDATEAFVSIEAIEQAREATSVRLQVNAAVVELSREGWPLEVLLRAADEAGEAGSVCPRPFVGSLVHGPDPLIDRWSWPGQPPTPHRRPPRG